MKKTLFAILFLFFIINIQAQQEAIFAQYHMNRYLINPAVAGSNNYHTVFTNLRFQWTSLPNAPKTGLVSYHGSLNNIGLGGMIFSDRLASLNRIGLNFAYAYHSRIKQFNLSIGLAGQFQRFQLDRSAHAGIEDPDDQVVYEAMDGLNVYDATAGIYLYNYKWYVGFSVPNMIQSKLNSIETVSSSTAQLSRYFLLTAGYKYRPEKSFFSVEPSILLRKVPSSGFQADLTMKFGMMDEQFFTAFTYGTSEIITMTMGYQITEEGMVAYSFDYSLGELYRYTKGSHEISFIWEFGKKDAKSKSPSKRFKG